MRRRKIKPIFKTEAIALNQQMRDRERGKHGKKERGAMEAEGLKMCIEYLRKDPKLQDF